MKYLSFIWLMISVDDFSPSTLKFYRFHGANYTATLNTCDPHALARMEGSTGNYAQISKVTEKRKSIHCRTLQRKQA